MFYFPNEEIQKISDDHKILKVLSYLLITDMDSASLKFIVFANKVCDLGERGTREILLKIFLDHNIHRRLNRSSDFFEQFDKRNERIRKHVVLYELENIEHRIMKNIRKLEKELTERILITTLTECHILTKLEKVQIDLLRKKSSTFPKQER